MSPKNQIRRGKARPKTSKQSNCPMQIKSNVEFRHRYRFVSTSGTATAVTPTSLLAAAGSTGLTVVAVATLCSSVKVNRIEILTPPASQGANATCSVEWTGFNNSPDREFSDTTISVATPARVSCSPPPQSLASFWQVPGNTTLFTVVAPTGSIIDVILSLILADGSNNAAVSVATAVVGNIYYLSLDPNATHRYTPVSLTTTI